MTTEQRVERLKEIPVQNSEEWSLFRRNGLYSTAHTLVEKVIADNDFTTTKHDAVVRKFRSDNGEYSVSVAQYAGFFSSEKGVVIDVRYRGRGNDIIVQREAEFATDIYNQIVTVAERLKKNNH